ncbi:hypothetical protein [uncultured Modestobacter sp.]|uniref:hypothetical protein n=1 Tax=uncultured Modestobacter sp. TaxID=380048 RepID=UPI002603922D|nr:hypothetical protein [uncultured Modestobacter sp.]
MPTDVLVVRYLQAKRAVLEAGHAAEIAWQARAGGARLTAAAFVREAAWVVLSAGMSEAVVRAKFPALERALHHFHPGRIAADPFAARTAALAVFGHARKVDAILSIATTALELGDAELRARIKGDPEEFLRALPYIGPVTWRHLAKNLGAPVAKADRHLVRLAAATGRPDVDTLCDEISGWLGEPVAVVDVVLWRWAVLHAAACPATCDGVPHAPGQDRRETNLV